MHLISDLPIVERQRLSALRTHEERRKSTEAKIRVAVHYLRCKNVPLTQKAIGEYCNLTRQTVARYITIISNA
jgi:hypothetical protein